MDIIKLIELIKTNPPKYLGGSDFKKLRPFIDGWYFRDYSGDVKIDLFSDFFAWLQKLYHVGSNCSWDKIIIYYSQDNYEALNNFFKLWEEFLKSRSETDEITKSPSIETPYRDITSLISLIKTRPSMYLGSNSIVTLKAYIDGWYFRNTKEELDMKLLDEFHNWLQNIYKMPDKRPWDRLMLYISTDDNNGLNYFFKLWDEFLASRSSVA